MILKQLRLQRFCGFTDFVVDFCNFTVLIGPNNGGKTTILRAIKFGFDAFQLCFGDKNEPNLGALHDAELQIGLAPVGNRLGVTDLTHLYFGRTQQEQSTLGMIFITTVGDVSLEISCLANRNNVKLTCQRDNKLLKDVDEAVSRQIVNELYRFKTQFVPPVGTISPQEKELSESSKSSRRMLSLPPRDERTTPRQTSRIAHDSYRPDAGRKIYTRNHPPQSSLPGGRTLSLRAS